MVHVPPSYGYPANPSTVSRYNPPWGSMAEVLPTPPEPEEKVRRGESRNVSPAATYLPVGLGPVLVLPVSLRSTFRFGPLGLL